MENLELFKNEGSLEKEFERYAIRVRREAIYRKVLCYFEAQEDQVSLPPFLAALEEMKRIGYGSEIERKLYRSIVEEENATRDD